MKSIHLLLSVVLLSIKTFKKIWQGERPALIFLSCVTLLSGCATFGFKQPEPVTVGQVIQMSKEGVPPEAIVKKMRDSETVYRFTGGEIRGAARSGHSRSGPRLYAANEYPGGAS